MDQKHSRAILAFMLVVVALVQTGEGLKQKWTPPRKGCTINENVRSLTTKCFKMCEKECEAESRCHSIDFNPTNSRCYLNYGDSTSSKFTTNCGDEVFSEPTGLQYNWTPQRSGCTIGDNVKVVTAYDIKQCKQECEAEQGCKSIDFNPTSFKCYLNRGDSTSSAFTTSCGNEVFSEPTGLKNDWSPQRKGCTIGDNVGQLTTNGIEECKQECEAKQGCKSIDFNPTNSRCYLNRGDSTSSAFTTSCGNEVFSEPTDLQCYWTTPRAGCTVNENVRSSTASDVVKCEKQCDAEPRCKSIDFNPDTSGCFLNLKDSSSSAFRSPCPVRAEVFCEPAKPMPNN